MWPRTPKVLVGVEERAMRATRFLLDRAGELTRIVLTIALGPNWSYDADDEMCQRVELEVMIFQLHLVNRLALVKMVGGGKARQGFMDAFLPRVEAVVPEPLQSEFQDTYDRRLALYSQYMNFSPEPGQLAEKSVFGQWSQLILGITGVPLDEDKLDILRGHAKTMLLTIDSAYTEFGVYGR